MSLGSKTTLAFFSISLFSVDMFSRLWAHRIHAGVLKAIPGWLEINVLRNRGFIFGWGFEWSPLWVSWMRISVLLLLFILIGLLFRLEWGTETVNLRLKLGGLLMTVGGIGNTLEGILRGYVTDFISIWRFPVFNVADAWVVVGSLLLLQTIFRKKYAPDSL